MNWLENWWEGILAVIGISLFFKWCVLDGITDRLDKLISETKSLKYSIENQEDQFAKLEIKNIYEEVKQLNDWTTSHTFSGKLVNETREISRKLDRQNEIASNLGEYLRFILRTLDSDVLVNETHEISNKLDTLNKIESTLDSIYKVSIDMDTTLIKSSNKLNKS